MLRLAEFINDCILGAITGVVFAFTIIGAVTWYVAVIK
jgi:hypothetical protein